MNHLLGLSTGFHDSSSCILDFQGNILFAASEERFSRIKGDSSFPVKSLNSASIFAKQNDMNISSLVVHENIFDQPSTSLFNGLIRPKAFLKSLYKTKSKYDDIINTSRRFDVDINNIFFSNHHLAHAYASIGTCTRKDGLILVLDAIGQRSSGLIGKVENNTIVEYSEIRIKNSLGLIYSAVTVFCGFKVLTGEYKLMGLAPYGVPRYIDQIKHVFGDPAKRLPNIADIDIFDDRLSSRKLSLVLGFQPRDFETPLEQRYADLAASIQLYLEQAVVELVNVAILNYGIDKNMSLFLGGGVALNCKLNLTLSEQFSDFFEYIWTFPASGDTGSSVGACIHYLAEKHVASDSLGLRSHDNYSIALSLGPSYNHFDTKNYLHSRSLVCHDLSDAIFNRLVKRLAKGDVGSVYDERSEFGPRALGNRSIIASPACNDALLFINRMIKNREDFRPLAPVVLEEEYKKYFNLPKNSEDMARYMLTLARSNESIVHDSSNFDTDVAEPQSSNHSLIPAVVHLDGTSRIQLLPQQQRNMMRLIVEYFFEETGIPILINTSFNVRGEPIVETFDDAIECFKSTSLAFMIINNNVIFRDEQDELALLSGPRLFPLD